MSVGCLTEKTFQKATLASTRCFQITEPTTFGIGVVTVSASCCAIPTDRLSELFGVLP